MLGLNPSKTGIHSLHRLSTPDGRRVDIVESLTDCALNMVVRFPFTHLINYITGSGLVVCHPVQTLVDRISYIKPWSNDSQRLFERYRDRGFNMPLHNKRHSRACEKSNHYCTLRERRSNDRQCFTFEFHNPATENRAVSPYKPAAIWMWGQRRGLMPKILHHIHNHSSGSVKDYYSHTTDL